MSLLCSVQTSADGTIPGSLVFVAVLALSILAIAFAVPALIRANRVIHRMPLPEEPSDVIRGNHK